MCKCSEAFEDKFVQCFDHQEIAMYIKRNGTVKLVHGEVIEMTNFNFCPYCGRNLKPILLNGNDNNAGAMAGALASIPPLKPPEIQTELQKTITEAIQSSLSNMNNNIMRMGGL